MTVLLNLPETVQPADTEIVEQLTIQSSGGKVISASYDASFHGSRQEANQMQLAVRDALNAALKALPNT